MDNRAIYSCLNKLCTPDRAHKYTRIHLSTNASGFINKKDKNVRYFANMNKSVNVKKKKENWNKIFEIVRKISNLQGTINKIKFLKNSTPTMSIIQKFK